MRWRKNNYRRTVFCPLSIFTRGENIMNQRMESILECYENNALGLDDTFEFKCKGCGKCCYNREDILLTTRDLYNIAKYFGRSLNDILDRYCETYTGEHSRLPIVRLRPSGTEKVCPLLRDKKCIVHKSKPVVCALFPLGRAIDMRDSDGGVKPPDQIEPVYFLQPIDCGTKDRKHTVREWLNQFGLPVVDEFYVLWTETTTYISKFLREFEKRSVTPKTIEILRWGMAFSALYGNYDPEKDLISQFRENAEKLRAAVPILESEYKKYFGRMKSG